LFGAQFTESKRYRFFPGLLLSLSIDFITDC
jgi:hypothetical protein